jgi:hypothetical protein
VVVALATATILAALTGYKGLTTQFRRRGLGIPAKIAASDKMVGGATNDAEPESKGSTEDSNAVGGANGIHSQPAAIKASSDQPIDMLPVSAYVTE